VLDDRRLELDRRLAGADVQRAIERQPVPQLVQLLGGVRHTRFQQRAGVHQRAADVGRRHDRPHDMRQDHLLRTEVPRDPGRRFERGAAEVHTDHDPLEHVRLLVGNKSEEPG
jgi:hypothetical protein